MRYLGPYELFKGLQRPGRLLGVDIGHYSLGLALSDTDYQLAYPLCVLPKDPNLMKSEILMKKFVFNLRKLMTDYDASRIVFGYPYLQGMANTQAFHIPNTVDGLSASGMLDDVTYTLWDEAYTSKLVKRLMEPHYTGEHDKVISDTLAGTGILQAYLDGMNRYTILKGREKEDGQYIF